MVLKMGLLALKCDFFQVIYAKNDLETSAIGAESIIIVLLIYGFDFKISTLRNLILTRLVLNFAYLKCIV